MKKLAILTLAMCVAVSAHATLSEGEAAIIGGIVGYGIRSTQENTRVNTYPQQPVVIEQRRIYRPHSVYVVPNQQRQIYVRPQVREPQQFILQDGSVLIVE